MVWVYLIMKMRMKKVFFLISLCLLCGCQRKESPMALYGFGVTEQVRFHPVKSDFLFKPTAIEVFDSLVLVHDPVENNTYTLFRPGASAPLLSGGQKGSGPDDILYGQFIDKINDKELLLWVKGRLRLRCWELLQRTRSEVSFYVSDHGKNKIFSYDMDSVLADPDYTPSVKLVMDKTNFPSEYEYINDTLCIARTILPIGSIFNMVG